MRNDFSIFHKRGQCARNEGTVNGMWTDPEYALRDVGARQAAIARDVAAWRTATSAGVSVPAAAAGDDHEQAHCNHEDDGGRNEAGLAGHGDWNERNPHRQRERFGH